MEARWGRHEYHYTDHKGRPQKKVKRWFGFSVNGIFAEHGKDHCRRRGCRFPLSRSAARTKVQPPFSPGCDGSDIRHVKAECGIDCGCHRLAALISQSCIGAPPRWRTARCENTRCSRVCVCECCIGCSECSRRRGTDEPSKAIRKLTLPPG